MKTASAFFAIGAAIARCSLSPRREPLPEHKIRQRSDLSPFRLCLKPCSMIFAGALRARAGQKKRPLTIGSPRTTVLSARLYWESKLAFFAPEWDVCLASIMRPAAQTRIRMLMERGFHQPGDVENRLGYHVGQLGTESPKK